VIGFKILDKDQDIYTASSSKNILKNVWKPPITFTNILELFKAIWPESTYKKVCVYQYGWA
jgi:hypothetical protein